MTYELIKPAEDALISEAGDGWLLKTISMHRSDTYYTQLQQEIDTLSDGSIENYWYVNTYRLDAEGYIQDLINDTSTIDNYPEALQNYGWHLDLYYSATLEETMK
jgi:hypothetical protein